MALLRNTQYERLMAMWREQGIAHRTQVERVGKIVAECALRVRDATLDTPVAVLVGAGEKGAVGMAAALQLYETGIPLQVILEKGSSALSDQAAFQYARLQENGIRTWGLSLSEEEMAEQGIIEWMRLALVVDTFLDPTITEDPRGDGADLIRMVNSTRRPILSLHVPSGVGSDEGYIYSPCIRATYTLSISVPLISVAEAWMVAGDVWVADVGIPSNVWEEIGEVPPTFPAHTSFVEVGTAKRLLV